MRIGFIGTGTIASAVVEGIAGDGHTIAVSTRNTAHSARLAGVFSNVTVHDNQAVVDRSDVICVALVAGVAPGVLGALTFRPGQRVVSLMAGMSLAEVGALVAPAQGVAVMIPFSGMAQGGSPFMGYGDTGLLQQLFGARNTLFTMASEADLDAYMCAQAVLSPALRMVADAADWLGARVDGRAQGEAFLRALVGSTLEGADCATSLAALNTKGGYNQRLRDHMTDAGMGTALAAGLDKLERGT
jgi:pyrroline-5-carboxylate reductase